MYTASLYGGLASLLSTVSSEDLVSDEVEILYRFLNQAVFFPHPTLAHNVIVHSL